MFVSDYKFELPYKKDLVSYGLKASMTIKEVKYNVIKAFELDCFGVDDLKVVLTASLASSGRVLEANSTIRDVATVMDVLGLYEKPCLTAVHFEGECTKKLLLDYGVPLVKQLPLFSRCFRLCKPKEEYAFMICTEAHTLPIQGVWLNSSFCLEQTNINEKQVLAVFPVLSLKSVPRSVVETRTTKTGYLCKQSTAKWIERGPNAPPETEQDNMETEIANIKKEKRFWSLAPPFLFCYKNEGDTFPIEIIPTDLFIMKIKNDGLGNRITLLRGNKLERSDVFENLKIFKQNIDPFKTIKNFYSLTTEESDSNVILEGWYNALAPHCMNTGFTRVFGTSLQETVDKQAFSSPIPTVISTTIRYLDGNGLDVEGIFRLSGNIQLVTYYKDLFDVGELPTLDDLRDPHTAASLLKQYLRELPEPILTFDIYKTCMDISFNTTLTKQDKAKKLVDTLNTIPDVNFLVLKCLLSLLRRVSQFSEINKMNLSNLATVFGPNLLRSRVDSDPMSLVRETFGINEITQLLIENEHLLLPRPEPKRQERKFTVNTLPQWTEGGGALPALPSTPSPSLPPSDPPQPLPAPLPTSSSANSLPSMSLTGLGSISSPSISLTSRPTSMKPMPMPKPKKRPSGVPPTSGAAMPSTSESEEPLYQKIEILQSRVQLLEQSLEVERAARGDLEEKLVSLMARVVKLEGKGEETAL